MPRALAILALLVTTSASAATVQVVFVPSRPGEATIELRQLTRVADYQKPPVIWKQVKLSEPLSLDLPEGHWALDVVSQTVWHATQTFSVFSAPVTVQAPLQEAGTVAGHLETADKSPLPAEVRLAFDNKHAPAACAVSEGVFRCAVPVGTLDLRLRAAGCVTRFYPEREVTAGAPLDVGLVKLVRGATLIGRVDPGRGTKFDDVQVRAKGLRESLVARLDRDGLFHIDGIAPGRYEVTASAGPRLRSQTVSVEVKPFMAAEMQDLLRLQHPKSLRVFIVPPFDPHNRPWRVELDHRLNPASITGEWSATQLPAGKYDLRVLASDQNEWHRETVQIADSDVMVNVVVAPRVVHGVLTRAGKGVSAHVELTDEGSTLSFESDEDGHFTGEIPLATAEWTATIKSETPPIRCKLEHVRPAKRDDSNDADLVLRLPNTAISGTVVDENAMPVAALVNISGGGAIQQVRSGDDGSFFVSGLPGGHYGLEASAFLKESDPYELNVTEDGVADGVKLVVRDVEKIHGRVVSDFGPVPGATVVVTPTDVPARMTPVNWTDENGEFSTYVGHGARQVNIFVAAPGYALKFFHSAMHQGMLTVPVGQSGGSIRVPKLPGDKAAYLVHNGSIESVAGMQFAAVVVDQGDAFFLPAVDAGAYSLCYLAQDEAEVARGVGTLPVRRCESAFLAPFGSLAFSPTPLQ